MGKLNYHFPIVSYGFRVVFLSLPHHVLGKLMETPGSSLSFHPETARPYNAWAVTSV